MATRSPSLLRVITVGAASGIAATLLMDQFLKLASSSQKALEKQEKLAQGESPWTIAHEQVQEQQQAGEREDSTEIVARRLATAAGQHLTQAQKKSAGHAVHYTFGTLMGVTYALLAEHVPEITTGAGFAYGTLLFFAADEIAVPALRLSPPPTQSPATDQLQHWAAHVVYGSSLDLVRNLLRRFL
jgi:Protein of unknown function (DUF1440)